ncbi:MAG: AraC family transcriptional regulator [Balneolaceae bacterium]|nr:MAG: AraC family transcriptional regulator [Balneolaceae bacterium]
MIGTESFFERKVDKRSVKTKLYVRYRVSLRCKEIVKNELKKLNIKHSILPYGGIEFHGDVSQIKLDKLRRNLQRYGLVLLDVHESLLVNRIIITISEVIHNFEKLPKLTYSEVIAKNIGETNESVLKIFSEVVGMSVVQFIILQKIERIKELLLYDDMPLAEIADLLSYKSEQHLVAQFKKVTGLNPGYFKKLKKERMIIASQRSQN